MEAREKERRVYIRNAVVCFVCTAICIGIDIKNFYTAGGFYVNTNIIVSFVLYILLIFAGIRAVKQAKKCRNEKK